MPSERRAGVTARLSLAIATVLAIALVAGACSAEEKPAEEAAPAAATPSGPPVPLGDANTGATVELPAGWAEIPLQPDQLDQALKEIEWAEKAHADAARRQAEATGRRGEDLVAEGALRYAVDPASAKSSPEGFVTNASIMRLTTRAEQVDQLVAEVRSGLGQNDGIQELQVKAVKLPGGDAARATYRLQGLDVTYVALQGDGEALVLVMGTDQPDTYQPVFDQVAKTLRPAG